MLSPQVSLRDSSRKAQTHLSALHDLLKNTADHIQHSDELKSRMSPEEWGKWRLRSNDCGGQGPAAPLGVQPAGEQAQAWVETCVVAGSGCDEPWGGNSVRGLLDIGCGLGGCAGIGLESII